MAQSIMTPASQYEVYGNGFGALTYNGQQLARVSAFKDSGQQPLGNPIVPYAIGDKVPPTIISPQALQAGKLEIHVYALRNEGLWGSIMGGRFASAKNLADLFGIQLEEGAVQLEWVVLDGAGNAVKGIVYKQVTIVNAQRAINVDAQSGANTATYIINAMYTDTLEKSLS